MQLRSGPAFLAFLALALPAALAGCAADGDAPGPADDLGLQATATTGVLRGVVVDQAIRPVANATVTAQGPDSRSQTALTDAEGLFGFAGLAPGTWFVTTEKVAYSSAQTSAEVVAGVDDPPLVKLGVVFDPGQVPFYVSAKVEAFVQCIIPGANACAIVNLYPCILLGACDPTLDDTSFVVLLDQVLPLQRTPDWVQTEIVWQSTQAVTPGLGIQYSNYDPENPGRGAISAAVRGRSPLVYGMDQETLAEWEVGTATGIGHEIFGHMDETSAVGSLGFVVNQRVDFYFTVFYGYTPPEGWTFSGTGEIPPPPA